MKTAIIGLLTATVMSAALVGSANANTIWRFPYKSTPYAVPHDHTKQTTKLSQPVKSAHHKHG